VSLATDDRDVADVHDDGGVNVAVETALAEGYDPVDAVSMATLNTAEAYDLPSGRLTPGAPADLVLLEDLEEWVVDGVLVPDPADDVIPVAVIERHGGEGGIGRGFVHGFGLERGAIASTVGHDAHNLLVAGRSHEAMAHVANHLRDVGGGYAVYDPSTDETTTLALPVAGLMSDEPVDDVVADYRALLAAGEYVDLVVEADA